MAQTASAPRNGNGAPAAVPPKRKLSVTSGVKASPARVMLYAPEGLGKSTFAAESPAPLFLDVERGTSRLAVARLLDGTTWTWPLLLETVRDLETDPILDGYQSLVLDTIDVAEQLCWAYLIERHKPRSKEGLTGSIESFGWGKGYTVALESWQVLLAALERVQLARRVNVILLGHSIVKTFKNPAGEDFDRYVAKVHEKAAGLIKGWCDIVAFGMYETVKDAQSGKQTGTGARMMHTQWNAAFDAKSRYAIPAELALDAKEFWQAIEAGKVGQPDHLRQQVESALVQLSDQALVTAVRAAVAKAKDNTQELARILDKAHAKLREQGPTQAPAAEVTP